jgi:nucleoside phosphorylase
MGNGLAAIVAKDIQRSFPIKFGLMVGVGGGVWSKTNDVRLGDVVVSQPTGTHGGVVQWDFGKMGKDGKFQRTGSLDKPPAVLLHALQVLRIFDITDGVNMEEGLSLIVRKKPRMGQTYRYQGADHDQLFEATYDHEGNETCDECDAKLIVQRPARDDSTPRIHYGNIASGNEVIKHGITRDKIAKEEGVICFEMEAAGLMDNFRCLVIRGICDYADSHKNKIWQPYAAATAAVYARALLGFIDKQEVMKTQTDEGYFSTTTRSGTMKNAEEAEDSATVYSDFSDMSESKVDNYVSELAADLFFKLPPDPVTLNRVAGILADRLREFALRVGYQAPTKMHLDVMVFIHKYRQ